MNVTKMSILDIIDSNILHARLEELENIDQLDLEEEPMITRKELNYLIENNIVPEHYPEPIRILLKGYFDTDDNYLDVKGKILCLLLKLSS